MWHYNPLHCLPSSAELPDSDDTPVDNELQNLVPNLLGIILAFVWQERVDWFFGVDMGIYFDPDRPPIVPDGFLSLGVERFADENGRLSYVLWEEDGVVPTLALEVVSRTYRGEYKQKMNRYAELGVRYYAIYNPNRRRRRDPLEVYRLSGEGYERLTGEEPIWLEDIGLGLGRAQGQFNGWQREWLYWFDREGHKLPTFEELAEQERQRAEQERQRAEQAESRAEQAESRVEQLMRRLREQGIDPDSSGVLPLSREGPSGLVGEGDLGSAER